MSLLPAPQFSSKHKKSKSTSLVASSLKLKSHKKAAKSINGNSSSKSNCVTAAQTGVIGATNENPRANSIDLNATNMLYSKHKLPPALRATKRASISPKTAEPTVPKAIYTYAEDTLSPTAIYTRNKKNRIYQTPSTQTLGLPTQPRHTAASSIRTNVSNKSSSVVSYHPNSPTKSEISNRSREYGLKAAQSAVSLNPHNTSSPALHRSASTKRNSILSSSSLPSSISLSVPAEGTNYLQNIDRVEAVARQMAETKVSKFQYRQSLPPGSSSQLDSPHIISIAKQNSVRTISKIDTASNNSDTLINTNHALSNTTKHNNRSKSTIFHAHELDFSQDPHYLNALQVAREKSLLRQSKLSRIDIGGGKFMTQNEIDTIAKRHVRPVLNEISYKAQEQRQKDRELFPFGLTKDNEDSRMKRFVRKLNFFKKRNQQDKVPSSARKDANFIELGAIPNEPDTMGYNRNSFSTGSQRIYHEESFDPSNFKTSRQRQSFDTSLLNETVSTIGSSRIHTESPFDIHSQLDNTIKDHGLTIRKNEQHLMSK